jgi:UDP-N-acetylglucosamine 1-carboxyvinyltransferase
MRTVWRRPPSFGTPIDGTVEEYRIQGAKNSVLPLLYAAVAIGDKTRLINTPNRILDLHSNIRLLRSIGACIEVKDDSIEIFSENLSFSNISRSDVVGTRYSSLLLSLASSHRSDLTIPFPGGCNLKRPLDIHLEFFRQRGASIDEAAETISYRYGSTQESNFRLRFPSVGATLNAVIAASTESHPSVIDNISIEPEVMGVVDYLASRGVGISFLRQRTIRVEGIRKSARPIIWPIIPDRIEAFTALVSAILARRRLTLINARTQDIMPCLEVLSEMNVPLSIDTAREEITVYGDRCGAMKPVRVTTSPHPGFPTDAHPILSAVLASIPGISLIEEGVIPDRFTYLDEFRKVGVEATLDGNTLRIAGNSNLRKSIDSLTICAPDIRGGISVFLLALTVTRHDIFLENSTQILRGYENLDRFAHLFQFEQENKLNGLYGPDSL